MLKIKLSVEKQRRPREDEANREALADWWRLERDYCIVAVVISIICQSKI